LNAIENLIFDLDGTLIDSSEGVIDAVNYSLRQANQPEQSAESIRPFIGYPLEDMYEAFTNIPVAELIPHFRVRAVETMVKSTVVLVGVSEALAALKENGYRLAIATTKIRRHVDGIVSKFGWDSTFPVRVGADEVERVKPAPDAFRLAIERLGASAENSLVVGDTINDILAAQAVPVKVAAVDSPYGGREKLQAAGPDHFLGSVSELPDLLRALNG
jgi:phosphoglycolate phosphatase-like HAD superfamily hydrolase